MDPKMREQIEKIAASIAWTPIEGPALTMPEAATIEASINRQLTECQQVKVTAVRVEGDAIRVTVTAPRYGVVHLAGLTPEPCPCGSGQPAGACSICDAYPWDPPPCEAP